MATLVALPLTRRIVIWRKASAEPEVTRDVLRRAPDSVSPPLEIDLPTLFREGLEGFV